MIRITTFLLFLLFISCKSKEERAIESDEQLIKNIKDAIAKVEAEIEEMTKAKSCATDPADCRKLWVSSGSGCSPLFLYNVKDLDTVQLAVKFAEWKQLEDEYFLRDKHALTCLRVIPDSLFVKDCKCDGVMRWR